MNDNFVFSGFGTSCGGYLVTNQMLYEAVKEGVLSGFNEPLILESKNFQAFSEKNPGSTPFDYFVGHKMGFEKRYHVSPWPPTKERQAKSKTSLDLLLEAIREALEDSGRSPEEIDSWIVSTVSPHEQAPGIAARAKAYFVKPENRATTMTLTSGCAGFNKGVRRAIDHFKSNSEVRNILIAHTETMSHFLTQKNDFISHATFGDAAAAVVLTREKSSRKEGVLHYVNYHDVLMIDSVGVDKDWNLYMDGAWVKNRAVEVLTAVSREVLDYLGWKIDDLDLVVPHQTGNAILHPVAENLNLPLEKLYQGAQRAYGNISGGTIPVALTMLKKSNKFKPGMKILCPTAGVGGEYGAFAYVVPEWKEKVTSPYKPLTNKSILILHADSLLGVQIVEKLLTLGASVLAHANRENEWAMRLYWIQQNYPQFKLYEHKLEEINQVDSFFNTLGDQQFDIQLNLFSALDPLYEISTLEQAMTYSIINQQLSRRLLHRTKSLVIILGHPVENIAENHTSVLKDIFNGWHGLMGSMSGEAISKGIRTIWYLPSVYEKLVMYMDSSLKNSCRDSFNQHYSGILEDLVDRLIRSMYCVKVPGTMDNYKGPLVERTEKVFATICNKS